MGTDTSPVEIAEASVKEALAHGHNCVIIDTAGRLHVNDELMDELRQIKEHAKPSEVLLIVDRDDRTRCCECCRKLQQ